MAFNVTLEDSSPLVVYQPINAWNDSPQDDSSLSYYSGSSFHSTATKGASFSFSFNGTGVWIYGARRPVYGSYSISIDGQTVSQSDANASPAEFQQLLGAATNMAMGLHQVVLTNTGTMLDLDYMVFETAAPEGTERSSYDDSDPVIKYDSQWTSADHFGFYNDTIHYTQSPDAAVQLSFDGDAVAVYGTVAPSIGNYSVTLDGVTHQYNGGSGGSSSALHAQTLLYFASNIGSQPHQMTITANPSKLGDTAYFELDAISVFCTSTTSGNPVPSQSSSDFSPASRSSTFYTNKGVIASAVSAGVISLLGIIFLLLLCWKRRRADPVTYRELEEAKALTVRQITPVIPIQDVEKSGSPLDNDNQPPEYDHPHRSYHDTVSSRSTIHDDEIFVGGRFSVPNSHWSTVDSVPPYTKWHRRQGSDARSSWTDSYGSTLSDEFRILIDKMPMPPQFTVPRKPAPAVPPLRPRRPRETLQIPF